MPAFLALLLCVLRESLCRLLGLQKHVCLYAGMILLLPLFNRLLYYDSLVSHF